MAPEGEGEDGLSLNGGACPHLLECSLGLLRGGKLEESMDVSRGLTVRSHHEAPDRWIPAEGGEDRAIVG